MTDNRPIGIFDSGVGGLTVFAAVKKLLPNETLIYLGDTARVPYGTKSPETVIKYSFEDALFLSKHDVKAMVVACNTASSTALGALTEKFNVPLLGVVEPGADAAIEASKNLIIGVIGTRATIASDAYGKLLKKKNKDIRLVSRACPLFVPLVEEGWFNDDITKKTAEKYLAGLADEGIDVLILGCTHYPLLKDVIRSVVGEGITLVDSAETTAKTLFKLLKSLKMDAQKKENIPPPDRIYVTDLPAQFEAVAGRFLGEKLPPIKRATL